MAEALEPTKNLITRRRAIELGLAAAVSAGMTGLPAIFEGVLAAPANADEAKLHEIIATAAKDPTVARILEILKKDKKKIDTLSATITMAAKNLEREKKIPLPFVLAYTEFVQNVMNVLKTYPVQQSGTLLYSELELKGIEAILKRIQFIAGKELPSLKRPEALAS